MPQTPHFAPGRLVANSTRYSTAASSDGNLLKKKHDEWKALAQKEGEELRGEEEVQILRLELVGGVFFENPDVSRVQRL